MANRLHIRRGTAAAATSINPLLGDGEWGVETDTRKVKMGDGVTLWNALEYLALEINWLGEFASAPGSPLINDAYRDTTLGESRIWTGSQWDTMTEDGADGADGADGGPVPVGGTIGQLITKQSSTDGDVAWEDAPAGAGVPVGGVLNDIIVKTSSVDGEAAWSDAPVLASVTLGNYRLEHNAVDDTLDFVYIGP